MNHSASTAVTALRGDAKRIGRTSEAGEDQSHEARALWLREDLSIDACV
jgi:hypothetical protein